MRRAVGDAGRALSCLCRARAHSAGRVRASGSGASMTEAYGVPLDAQPRLPHGVRLVHNEAHGGWVLLAPERVFKADAIAAEIIKRCDGQASVRGMIAEFVRIYSAPREKIAADVTMLLSTLAQKKLLDL